MNERIERLREKAVRPAICYRGFYLDFYRRMSENTGDLETRVADAMAYAFDRVEPVIDEDELIVGRAVRTLSPEEEVEYQAFHDGIGQEVSIFIGMDSHMAVDFELLLKEGAAGVSRRIDGLMAEHPDKKGFYQSCQTVLWAMVRFSRRYAALARELADTCAEEQRKKELLLIAEHCGHVPEHPARSFPEALQAVHFLALCLSFNPIRAESSWQQHQLGRIDRYLLPYYEADGLRPEEAQEWFDCLAIQINHRVPNGLSSGYMVGGRDRNGKIVANDLTRIGLKAIDDVRLVYPAVGLCWADGMPDELLEMACTILSHGRSHPAIFNDDLIVQSLMRYGVPEQEAHDYIHSNCVEITPVGSSNAWVAYPYINMPQFLLDVMGEEHISFDDLLQAVFDRLDVSILQGLLAKNQERRDRMARGANPLLNCFVHDCLERGLDMDRGGARYNWLMPSFVGMANLVDSLFAVKKAVFEEGLLTLPELKAMTDHNFEGDEKTRLHLLNGYAKYGNNIDEVDGLFDIIVKHLVSECEKHTPVLPDAKLIPSVFCWIMHEQFGRVTGATPDGRPAGFPLGDGSGPCQGRELHGPTASVLSSTKWSHLEMLGGVAVNMKFASLHGDALRKLVPLIKVYLSRGGFEMQINVISREKLQDAQAHPEQYSDLVVRIGGYSDYFVKLSRQMQAELLLRTEHEL